MAAMPDSLDHLFAWARPGGPGCALGIYRDGETLLSRGFGLANIEHGAPITGETVFHVASLSKQVTAFCAGLLAERGALDLDDRLEALVPEMRAGGEITPRQILHHTSGLRDQWGLLDLAGWRHEDLKTDADILRLATRQRALNFAPGSRFQYINTGYTLIGTIIERISGKSLRAFAQEHVFGPLGMTCTHFHDDFHEIVPGRADAYDRDEEGMLRINVPSYATAGPTGLFTTIADFAAWERHLLSPEICSRDLVADMHRPGRLGDGQSTGYGYGLSLGLYRGLNIAEHAGGDAAFRAHYLRFPDQRLAIAIFCNTPAAPPGQLARRIADQLLAGHFDAGPATAPAAAAHASRAVGANVPAGDALLAYCGSYREPGGHDLADVSYRDGRLFLTAPGGPDYELSPVGDDSFLFTGMDATCRFEIVPGKPARFRTYYGGTETALLEAAEREAADPALSSDDYVGRYASEELDVAYDIEAGTCSLRLVRGKRGSFPLTLLSRDLFACPGGLSIRFCRDAANRVEAMTVSTERVWHVRFARSAAPGSQDRAISGQAGPSIGSPSR